MACCCDTACCGGQEEAHPGCGAPAHPCQGNCYASEALCQDANAGACDFDCTLEACGACGSGNAYWRDACQCVESPPEWCMDCDLNWIFCRCS